MNLKTTKEKNYQNKTNYEIYEQSRKHKNTKPPEKELFRVREYTAG
ncbi:MAG: hypothetical protein IJ192_11300 [Clostridia bacterium]|nr:hypothetical protein [Clostridia bacterium]MBR2176287.1 hypothetical protein [Clostridia bacterium]